MSSKLRVAIIESTPHPTGSVRAILGAARHMAPDVEVHFLAPDNAELGDSGFFYRDLQAPQLRKQAQTLYYPVALLRAAHKLRRYVRDKRIDIVHTNDFYNLTAPLARRLGMSAPVVQHIRLLENAYLRPVYGPLLRTGRALGVDKWLAVSDAVAADARKHGVLAEVVPDGIDVPSRCPSPAPISETIEVLYLSHFIRGKGHENALEAFAQAYRDEPGLRLRYVGGTLNQPDNELKLQAIRSRVSSMGLGQVVQFAGPSTDPAAEMARAHIVLMLSRSESYSMVCAEAMAQGRAVIASRCGGPEMLIEHDRSGLLVRVADPHAAANALAKLAKDVSLRQQLGKRAWQRAHNHFALPSTSMLLRDHYRALR